MESFLLVDKVDTTCKAHTGHVQLDAKAEGRHEAAGLWSCSVVDVAVNALVRLFYTLY